MKPIMQWMLALCLPLLAACASHETGKLAGATNGLAATAEGGAANVQEVLSGVKMIQDGHIQAAIDGPFDNVVRRYEAQYGNSKSKVYSARGMTDGLIYAAASAMAKPKVNVIVTGPAWAMAYWGRGYAYNEMARYDDAIVELRKALSLAPDDSQYQNELAYAYQQKGQWKQSLALYQAAADDAEFTSSDVSRAKCRALRGQGYDLVELHRLTEAEAAYHACLKLQPNEPKSLGELGYIRRLRAKGD